MEISSVSPIIAAFSQVFSKEVSVAISDRSKYLYYQPSDSIDLKIKPGDSIRKGSVTYKALQTKQKVSQYVASDLFGVAYYGMSIPLIHQGQAEGCLTAIFSHVMDSESIPLPKHPFLVGKREERWVPVPFHKISFLQALDGKTVIHTESQSYLNKYSLVELEKILPMDQFIRTHRSYFVNVNAIEEIHPHFHSTFMLVMKDQKRTHIPVSQKYASQFRQFLRF
ncbi:LytTR family DNA-binding domain-containing protein [Brevibacillus sp. H7]|jgi:two-component system LytT family response regulator|uniref:LytTR family DNA-binding domain-containing protein n=1 Tax=Brevibacillus sp. H7 TaxID=3349138 RepID=UPI00380BBFEA